MATKTNHRRTARKNAKRFDRATVDAASIERIAELIAQCEQAETPSA